MINHILLPTDFSVVADNALRYAIELCKKTESKLHLFHVKSIPVLDASFPAETYQRILQEMEDISEEGFAKRESSYLKTSGVSYEFHHATGFVNDEIIAFSKEKGMDLILMGTTGASGLQEILVGSNSASVIGKSDIPVLVIPPSSTFVEPKHILYSSDYSEPEFPAVSRMMFFADLFKAKVTVLHITTEMDKYFDSEHNFFVRNKKQISHEQITVVNKANTEVTEAIEKYITDHHVDMLVMAKHHRSFFDRLFHRSLSKRMAYHTKVPLLVLHK
ncbi:MAG: universal stress protein [Bacteroidota bacterium]